MGSFGADAPGVEPFETTFAVPLHCNSCVQSVSSTLKSLSGIKKVHANLKDQLVFVEGTAAPSSIVSAIESTGRDAILRGSGKSNSAGVCILETHNSQVRQEGDGAVRGLARIVQVSENRMLVDLTLKGLQQGTYWATVRERGDISRGAESTGGIWDAVKRIAGFEKQRSRGSLGQLDVDKDGRGSVFLDRPVSIWQIIGRSMVVSDKGEDGPFDREDHNTLVGVIARSAGVWDNDKVVCSCSGKTAWQERKEQQAQGML